MGSDRIYMFVEQEIHTLLLVLMVWEPNWSLHLKQESMIPLELISYVMHLVLHHLSLYLLD